MLTTSVDGYERPVHGGSSRPVGSEIAVGEVSVTRLPGMAEPLETLTSDDWYTPPYIIEALGLEYDLDPCAPPGGVSWIPAEKFYTEIQDGLNQPWEGRVWLNPPYSKPWPWLEKFANRRPGIALIPADTSTQGWHRWVTTCTAVVFLRHRVQFIQPGNENVTSARFPSALVAQGHEEAEALRHSQLGWFITEW